MGMVIIDAKNKSYPHIPVLAWEGLLRWLRFFGLTDAKTLKELSLNNRIKISNANFNMDEFKGHLDNLQNLYKALKTGHIKIG